MAKTRMNDVTSQWILESPSFVLNTIWDATDNNIQSIVVQTNVYNIISHQTLIRDVLSSVTDLIRLRCSIFI